MNKISLIALALGAVACGDSRTEEPITGVLTFDAGELPPVQTRDAGGVDAAVVGDAGPAPVDAGPVGTNPDGILTNRPDIDFVNVGDPALVIVTASFRLIPVSTDWSIYWAGEYENVGLNTLCIPFLDATMGGIDVLTIAEAPMWSISSSVGVSRYQCVGPGQRGAFYGLERVSSSFLETLTTVYYDMSALQRNEAHPDPALPRLVSADVVQAPGTTGWTIDNRWSTNSIAIYNFAATFYVRSGGLLWDDQPGFHLDDVPPFTPFDADTRVGYEYPFEEWIVYPDYLVRVGAGLVDVSHPDFRRLSEWRIRRRELRDRRETR